MSGDPTSLLDLSHVEVLVALAWEDGRYSARCLGVSQVTGAGPTMMDAVLALAEQLSGKFSAGEEPVGEPDGSALWQPLPVEMLTALDVTVERVNTGLGQLG